LEDNGNRACLKIKSDRKLAEYPMEKIIWLAILLAGIYSHVLAGNEDTLPASFVALVDRSDLIIVATPQTVCGGCMSEVFSYVKPGEDKEVPSYDTFAPKLKIDSFRWGMVPTSKAALAEVTSLIQSR
jgi:hypothetical protein